MKNLYLVVFILIVSCSESTDDRIELDSEVGEIEIQEEKQDSIIENKVVLNEPGIYEEFHENGQLKIEGLNNMYGNREGLWVAYYENGTKWSENFYTDGIKSGHSVTFFPNGNVRYVGEYKNDERVGTWKFYDEAGNLTNEENFSK